MFGLRVPAGGQRWPWDSSLSQGVVSGEVRFLPCPESHRDWRRGWGCLPTHLHSGVRQGEGKRAHVSRGPRPAWARDRQRSQADQPDTPAPAVALFKSPDLSCPWPRGSSTCHVAGWHSRKDLNCQKAVVNHAMYAGCIYSMGFPNHCSPQTRHFLKLSRVLDSEGDLDITLQCGGGNISVVFWSMWSSDRNHSFTGFLCGGGVTIFLKVFFFFFSRMDWLIH